MNQEELEQVSEVVSLYGNILGDDILEMLEGNLSVITKAIVNVNRILETHENLGWGPQQHLIVRQANLYVLMDKLAGSIADWKNKLKIENPVEVTDERDRELWRGVRGPINS